jgi:predicted outer membrane repeat protein
MRVVRLRTLSLVAAIVGLTAHNGLSDVVYVSASAPAGGNGASWNTAFNDLQAGLMNAQAGDEIWVAAGLYRPTGSNGDRFISFEMRDGVAVYGGFDGTETSLSERDFETNVTVLSGDLNGNDVGGVQDPSHGENSHRVVRATDVDEFSALDGFTITGGQAVVDAAASGAGMFSLNSATSVRNCAFIMNSARLGAGLAAGGPAAPSLQNVAFSSNRATAHGYAGAYLVNVATTTFSDCRFEDNVGLNGGSSLRMQNSNVTVRRSVFENNHSTEPGVLGGAGGVYALGTSTLLLEDCTFRANSGSSGAAVVTFAPLTVVRCLFENNQCGEVGGGAVAVAGTPPSTDFRDCIFRGNTSLSTGGAVDVESNLSNCRFVNCVFSANSSQQLGGAVFVAGTTAALINCTLNNNNAVGSGGGACFFGKATAGAIDNCVLWANTAPAASGQAAQVSVVTPATLEMNYSCVQDLDGSLGGIGNIDDNPLFVDADGADNIHGTADDDLRLNAGSPCIDAGNNAAVPAGVVTDIAGNPRFVDDPATIDTGAGDPPIVDLGAHEFALGRNCPVDINNSGSVDVDDLIAVILSWGCVNPPGPCDADVDGSGTVDVDDLIAVILAWGPCP